MKTDHIVLIAGLGSSWFWRWNRWSKWARDMESRLGRHYAGRRDVRIWAVSSDGTREKEAFDAIIADHRRGTLGKVVGGGHSNGDRDFLKGCERLYANRISVAYGFGIDMTLGEFGAQIFGNIEFYEEFWAGLQKADKHPSFSGKFVFHDVDAIERRNVGHTESASLPWVQNTIFKNITRAIR